MKSLRKIVNASVGLSFGLILSVLTLGMPNMANAATNCVQYDPGATTPTTPVFNHICGVPQGVGDEPDFVRIRQSSNGNDQDNQNNPLYTNAVNAVCNTGDKFDIWTYVHNNAVSAYNDNGSGSAVAHNVKMALSAPTNTTNDKFTFLSSVSASNAAGVQDTATLTCKDGKQVKLTLVPSTVHVYSQQYNWKNLDDSTVNGGAFKIGSPTFGSGDQWGCWEYRIVVVYQVTVKELPPPPPQTATAMCTLFKIEASSDRKVTVTDFLFTNHNATFKNAVINWAANVQNGPTSTITDSSKVKGQTFQYGKDGTYLVTATVSFTNTLDGSTIVSNPSDSGCATQVTFKTTQPPTVTPPPTIVTTSTPTPAAPTALVNTGAGSVVGMFAAATVAGTFLYRRFLTRRLSEEV